LLGKDAGTKDRGERAKLPELLGKVQFDNLNLSGGLDFVVLRRCL
jgi:hypothetical protein